MLQLEREAALPAPFLHQLRGPSWHDAVPAKLFCVVKLKAAYVLRATCTDSCGPPQAEVSERLGPLTRVEELSKFRYDALGGKMLGTLNQDLTRLQEVCYLILLNGDAALRSIRDKFFGLTQFSFSSGCDSNFSMSAIASSVPVGGRFPLSSISLARTRLTRFENTGFFCPRTVLPFLHAFIVCAINSPSVATSVFCSSVSGTAFF